MPQTTPDVSRSIDTEHTVSIRVVIHDADHLRQEGQRLFRANGGDDSERTLSEHIAECLMFGDSPVDHGFEIAEIS